MLIVIKLLCQVSMNLIILFMIPLRVFTKFLIQFLLPQFHLQSAAIPALDAAARIPDAALAGADEAGPRGGEAEQEVALLSRLSGTQGLLSSISQAQASARKGHQIRSGK